MGLPVECCIIFVQLHTTDLLLNNLPIRCFKMKIFFTLALVTCSVVLGVEGATKNVAIPKPGTACTDKIHFPVKALKGVKGYPGMVEVFGIPIIAGSKFVDKIGSQKLNHVASVMAELLDQDGDGCADDPNVLRNLLKNIKDNSM